MTRRVFFAAAVTVLMTWGISGAPTDDEASKSPPLVLLVSFDGFRWDYLQKTNTPHFDQLASSGVEALYTKDVFITKTFPNHFTLVTGLYEESHGVIGNAMYDPVFNSTFSMNSSDPKWWDQGGGEPVWVTNQKQGGQSAVILWPSGNVNFSGIAADYFIPKYNVSIPFTDRIDMIIDHFVHDNINFGALYFHEPDHSGHLFGPESPKMLPVIEMCDSTAGYLVRRLKETKLYDRMNMIITSDHGMTSISPSRVIVIEEYVDPEVYPFRVINNNPIVSIWPENDDDTESIYRALHGKSDHMTVYKKEDIPTPYHYRDNRRISPILLVAHEGWQIHTNSSPWWPSQLGTHGYNNSLMSMHPFFIAHGPAFKKGYRAEPFSSVNVYALVCHLLGIEPAPNNGSWENVRSLLTGVSGPRTTPGSGTGHPAGGGGGGGPKISRFTVIGVCLAGGLVILTVTLLLAMCLKQRTYREKPMQYHPIADTSLDKDVNEPFLPNSRI